MASQNKSFLKGVSYTFSSNMNSFIINALILLIVPKLIGSEEYGYFQYYTLLATYAAYFHVGICNGVTLKESGKSYDTLDRKTLASQHGLLVLFASIIFVAFQIFALFHGVADVDKLYMLRLVSFIIIFVNSRVFSTTVLLASSRFREYSHVIIIEKLIYALFLAFVLIMGNRNYQILILGDILGKIFAAVLGVYYCKEIIFSKSISVKKAIAELADNLKIGVLILITNLAGILITGIIQFFVEDQWDISTFGKVSLSFSISKMLMIVINAVSLVMLPFLKNVPEDRLPDMYKKIRTPLSTLLILMLLAYYPMSFVLQVWLPQYKDSIFFASLIFPMCLFESKTSMLINTYLKALRKERWLCIGNVLTVGLSALLAGVMVYIFKNLNMTVLVIPLVFIFRCVILERPLASLLNISVMKALMQEIIMAFIFICVNYFFSSVIACVLYFIAAMIYIYINRKEIKECIGTLKIKKEH